MKFRISFFKYRANFEPCKASCTVHIQTIYGKTVHCQNELNLLLVKLMFIGCEDEAFKKIILHTIV